MPIDREGAAAALRPWLERAEPITGVVAYNDIVALATLAGLQRNGVDVPRGRRRHRRRQRPARRRLDADPDDHRRRARRDRGRARPARDPRAARATGHGRGDRASEHGDRPRIGALRLQARRGLTARLPARSVTMRLHVSAIRPSTRGPRAASDGPSRRLLRTRGWIACARRIVRRADAALSDPASVVAAMTLEEKASLLTGDSAWTTPHAPAARPPGDPHGGRTARGSPDPADGVHGVRRELGDLLPDRLVQRRDLGPRPPPRDGPGARSRGDRARRRHRARTRRQHEALAAVRSELRVLLGGPVSRRRARGQLDRRDPGRGRRRVPEAPGGEQPGDAPDVGERGGRRADPARALPPGLRGGRQDVIPVDRDVLLQPDQRHLRVRAPRAADGHPARRVGVRRPRRLRLGGRPRSAGRRGRGPRSRDARTAAPPRAGRRRRRARRVPRRGRRRPGGPADPAGRSPRPTATAKGGTFDAAAHHALARRIAADGMVLLKNEAVLPLSPTGRIAVIGRAAQTPRIQGGGSSQTTPTSVDIPLQEIERAAGDAAVTYARATTSPAPTDRISSPRRSKRPGRRRRPPVRGPAALQGVRGQRPHRPGPDAPAGRADHGRRRGAATDRGRPVERLGCRHVRLDRPGAGRPAGLVCRAGRRGRHRRHPVRRRQPLRQARRDLPAPARGHAGVPELPGRG